MSLFYLSTHPHATPDFNNNYLVRLDQHVLGMLDSPNVYAIPDYLPQEYKPDIAAYRPVDDKHFVESVKKNAVTSFFSNTHNKGLLVSIYVYLDPIDLVQMATVNSYCYVALKADFLWKKQLEKLFPWLHSVPNTFSVENQFKIIYKLIRDYQKNFVLQLEHERKELIENEKKLANIRKICRRVHDSVIEAWLAEDRYAKKVELGQRQIGGCELALSKIPKDLGTQANFEKILKIALQR